MEKQAQNMLDAFITLSQPQQAKEVQPDPKPEHHDRKPHVRLTSGERRKVLGELVRGVAPEKVAAEWKISLSTALNIRRQYTQFLNYAKALREPSSVSASEVPPPLRRPGRKKTEAKA